MSLRHGVHLCSEVIVISKWVVIVGLERKWTHDYSFQVDGLAIDPRIAIVEFYVVDTFLREYDSLQEIFLDFLKVNRLGIILLLVIESSCVHDAEVDVQFL